MMDWKDLLISAQRALLDKVTMNLRSVCILTHNDNIEFRFYYNQPPSEQEEELASLADSEFISDFPSPEYNTRFCQMVIPFPEKIPDVGYCIYQRYEPSCH
jgi:hypothetical protein